MREATLIFVFAAATLPGFAQAVGSDIEMWNEVDLMTHVLPHTTLTVPFVLRDSFTLANPQLAGIGPIFDVTIARHVTGTIGYLYVAVPNTGPGFNANVPLGAVTLHKEARGINFADRNRAECLFGIPGKPVRYRNKLVIEAPKLDHNWRPYVSDEVFYDFSQSLWSQNRFQIGAVHSFSDVFRLNLFYLERDAHRSNPTASHAIGLAAEVHVGRGRLRRGLPNEEN